MGKAIDLTGHTFCRLLVIERVENYITPKGQKHARYLCKCECGNEIKVRGHDLRTGNTKSCGCLKKETSVLVNITHGMGNTRLYRIWRGMKQRCKCESQASYKNYGGRGITVCDEWENDFKTFYDWAMVNGYKDNLTIDRKDVNGNYEPSNCKWATYKEQANNRRNRRVEKYRESKSCAYAK